MADPSWYGMDYPMDRQPTRIPGWYWVRTRRFATPDEDEWECVHVLPESGKIVAYVAGCAASINLSDLTQDNNEWIGPITPRDADELDQLRRPPDDR